jgi:autotransporter-associated beta strand protein
MAARRVTFAFSLAAAAVLLFAPGPARAQQTSWNVQSGDWSVGSYWTAGLPTNSTDAYIVNGGTATITTAGDTCNDLWLGSAAGSGTVQMTDGALSAGTQYVGYSGTGTFTQSGGSNSAYALSLGASTGSSGTYNLNGGTLCVCGISQGAGAAAFSFGGGTLQAAAPFSTSVPIALSISGGSGTVDPLGNPVALLGALSGPGGLAVVDSGTLTLAASNTYTGGTTIAGGTLATGSVVVSGGASGLGNAASPVVLGGLYSTGTLSYAGSSATFTRGFTVSGGGSGGGGEIDIATPGQTLTIAGGAIAGSGPVTIGGAGNTTVGSVISAAGGLQKSGGGLLTLTAANTYTGGTSLIGGTLLLGFSAPGAPAANIISPASWLTMNGGTLAIESPPGGAAVTQQFYSVSGCGTIRLNSNGNPNLPVLSLGYVSTNMDSVLIDDSLGGTATTATKTDSSGIYGGFLVYYDGTGYNWATTTSTAAPYVISGATTATPLPATGALAGSNYFLAGSGSVALSQTANTLKITPAAAGGSLVIGDGQTLTLSEGGLLFTGSNDYTISGGALAAGFSELAIHQYAPNANLTIASTLSGSALAKTGPGTLTLSGFAYGGGVAVLAGTLALSGTLSTPNFVEVGPWGAASCVQTGGQMIASQLSLGVLAGGCGTYTLSAGSFGASTVVGGGGTGVFTQSGGSVSPIFLDVGCERGGSGAYNISGGSILFDDGGGGALSIGTSGTGAFVQSGGLVWCGCVLVGGGGAYSLIGGRLGAQSEGITGTFAQSGGTNAANSISLGGSGAGDTYNLTGGVLEAGVISGGSGAGTLSINGGTLQTGWQSSVTAPVVAGPAGATIVAPFAATFSCPVSGPGALVKAGAGTLILAASNTYAGGTTINAGSISLTGSVIGAGTLAVGGGTFSYVPATNGGTGNSQTVAGLTINAGASGVNCATGNTLALGVIARSPGGMVGFNSNTAGTITSAEPNTNGILGPWATYGTGSLMTYAAATGNTAPYTIAAYTGATAITSGVTGLADTTGTVNYAISGGGGTLAAAVSANTLQFTGAANTITAPGANSLSLNGIMNVGSGTATIAGGNLIVGSTQELVFTGPGNVTVTAAIQDNGNGPSAVTMAANGTLILGAANTYSGSTFVNGGTLALANSAALRQSTLDTSGGGALSFGSLTSATLGGLTGPGTVSLANATSAAVALNVGNNNNSTTFSGVLQGAGSLTKIGTGTLVLSGSNTYGGGTTLAAGTVQLGNASAIGTGPLVITGGNLDSGAANLVLSTNNAQTWLADFTFLGSQSLNLGTGSVALGGNRTATISASTLTVGGPISDGGSNYGLVKAGTGTLTLSGNSSYTGGTSINAGTLLVTGSLGNTAVNVGGGAALGGAGSIGGVVAVAGGSSPATQGAINLVDGAIGTLTLSDPNPADTVLALGGSVAGSPSVLNFEVGAAADCIQAVAGKVVVNPGGASINVTALPGLALGNYDLIDFVSGQASGLGSLSLATTLLGPYALSICATPTSEQLVVSQAFLTWSAPGGGIWNTASTNTPWLDSGGNATAFSNSTDVAFNLGGTYSITIDPGVQPSLAAFSATAGSYTFSGGAISGTGGLVMYGGTVTLNNANTYSGGTSLTAGLLNINCGSAAAATSSAIGTGSLTISGGSLGNTSGGDVTLGTNNVQEWSGNFAYLGSGNDLNLGTGALTLAGTPQVTVTANTLSVGGVISGAAAGLVKAGAGTLLLAGSNTYGGGTTISAGILQLGDGATKNGYVQNNVTDNGTLAFANPLSESFGGLISGSGSLAKSGAGTLTLTGNNTYSGGTTINTGVLQLGDGVSQNGSVAGNIADNSALSFANPSSQTFASVISGGGSVTKNAAGALMFTGSNTYTGGTTISAGILQLGDGATTNGYVQNNVTDNGTLAFANPLSESFGGLISGSGSLAKSGAGTLTLTGNNSYSGGTTINTGVLQLGDGVSQNGSVVGNIADNSALSFASPSSQTFAGIISGGGSVTKNAAGALTFTASNTYTGGTTISAGTLQLGDGATKNGYVQNNVTDNGTLAFANPLPQSFSGMISGSGSLTMAGPGTLTLSGPNTYTGGTTLAAGTLVLANAAAAGSGPFTLTGGSLSAVDQYVGSPGMGSFTQSGGTNSVSGSLVLAAASSSSGSYALGDGQLLAANEVVGGDGTATFSQTGGSNSVQNGLSIGTSGTYTLTGGTLAVAGQISGPGPLVVNGGCWSAGQISAPLIFASDPTVNFTCALVSNNQLSNVTYVGQSGTASLAQSTGTQSAGTMYLGFNPGAAGNYSLTGGSLAVMSGEYLGYGGTGSFTQSGGTHTVSGGLYLDYNPGSSGAYTLSGGSLAADSLYAAYSGTDSFTQSGGTNSSNNVYLGYNPGANGTYSLSSAGLLSAGALVVGNSGTGTFTQSGGTNTVSDSVYLGYNPGASGTYSLSGGSLSVGTQFVGYFGSGSFTQTGGTQSVANLLVLGQNPGSSGSYALGDGQLLAANEVVGADGTGTFNQTGGSNAAGGLSIGTSGTYTLTGGTLVVAGQISGPGPLVVNGGYWSGDQISAPLVLASDPSVNFTCALGDSNSLSSITYVGQSGTASLAQSSGTQSAGTMYFGFNPGAAGNYSLTGGSLAVMSGEYLGYGGTGSFTQSGGTHTVSGGLYLDFNPGSSGAYTLSGGSLVADSLYAAYSGTDSFTQSGGTSSVNNVYLGYNSGASGTYSLSNSGLLSAGALVVGNSGTGNFTQSGGTNTVSDSVYLGYNPGASGTYSLSGGSLSVGTQFVGYAGCGTFTQTGGTQSVGSLNLGQNPGSSGSYALSDGQLLAANEVVGGDGTGTFSQTGGSNAAGGLSIGTSGTYTLTGGTLVVGGQISGPGPLVVNGGCWSVGQISAPLVFASDPTVNFASALTSDNQLSNLTYVGQSGTASLAQCGNSEWADTIYFGFNAGASGSYSLADGYLNTSNEYLGYSGTGAFTQTGGVHTAASNLYLGYNPGGSGTYSLAGSGLLQAQNGYVGYSGTGSFTQSGGTNAISFLYLGYNPGGTGTYSLADPGLLQAQNGYVGYSGTGSFTQSGGTNSTGYLCLGYSSGSSGSYSLSDPGVLSPGMLVIGYSGTGNFTQSGGNNSVNNALLVGCNGGGSGTFSLGGSGQLFAPQEFIGSGGTGTFTQTGGTNTTYNLVLGCNDGAAGTYNLNGGALVLYGLSQGAGTAAFNFSGGTLTAATTLWINMPMALATSGGNATIDTGGNTVTLSGSLSGPGGLAVAGSGTLILAVSNNYTGGTSVNNGLLVAQDISAIPSGSLLAIGANGSVVLGTPGYTEIGMNPGGGPAGPLGSQPSGGGGGHPAPEPTALLLLAAAAACGLAAATRRRMKEEG